MKPLTAVRFGKVWVVSHETQDTLGPTLGETEQVGENSATFTGSEDLAGPPTLNAYPLRAVEWTPGDDEPFSLYDLARSSKPLAKTKTLHGIEAEAVKLAGREAS